jgi:hypothetical protein
MIKVLLLSANPIDSPLNIDEEFRAIDQKLRSSEHRGHVELLKHGAVRFGDLAGLLMRHRPHIVHFSGHGDTDGIALTGADGNTWQIPPGALATIFRTLKDNVRVVLLNACHSASQAEALVKVIDCAVGMNREIEDNAAIAFAAAFYEALGYGRSVQDAFDLASIQLSVRGTDHSLAELHVRQSVEASKVILVTRHDAVAGKRAENVSEDIFQTTATRPTQDQSQSITPCDTVEMPSKKSNRNPLHLIIDLVLRYERALWNVHHSQTTEAWDESLEAWRGCHSGVWGATSSSRNDTIRCLADPAKAWLSRLNSRYVSMADFDLVEVSVHTLSSFAISPSPMAMPYIYSKMHTTTEELWRKWNEQGDRLMALANLAAQLKELAARAGDPWSTPTLNQQN